MEKRVWTMPQAEVEKFEMSQYIAACGDGYVEYNFTCDAGDGWGDYHVYLNGSDGQAHTSDDIDWSGRDGWVKTFTKCSATHAVTVKAGTDISDVFPSGYMRRNGKVTDVIVWTDGGTNTHCTRNLNINSWEITKS